jgi:hypothetical protein
MAIQTVSLNGINIESLSLAGVVFEGWAGVPRGEFGAIEQPLKQGQRPMSSNSKRAPRQVALRLHVAPTSYTDRNERLNEIVELVGGGQVELSTKDAPDKVCYGLLETMDVQSRLQYYYETSVHADLRLICHDPMWYDRDPVLTYVPTGTRVEVTIGTGSLRRIKVSVLGAATNPILILRDQTGTEVQRMTLTGSPSSSQWVEVDCDRYSITRQTDGLDAFQNGWLAATETFFELRTPYRYTIECAQANLVVAHYRSYLT